MTAELPSIELRTYDAKKVLRFLDVKFDSVDGEMGATLEVQSNGFGCRREIWMGPVSAFIQDLESMDLGKSNCAQLWDGWAYSPPENMPHIKFSRDDHGHVLVSGVIYDTGEFDQRLNFCFQTDQTVLRPFIRDLTALLPLPKTK